MDSLNNGPDFARILELKRLEDKDSKNEKEIDELKQELKRREQIKKEEITLAQQLLLLHYLGLLNPIDLNTKSKSFLLSKILNRNCDNIRKNITYINSPKISYSKIKNVENLKLILKIFQGLSMPLVADAVKVDLNKLNKV